MPSITTSIRPWRVLTQGADIHDHHLLAEPLLERGKLLVVGEKLVHLRHEVTGFTVYVGILELQANSLASAVLTFKLYWLEQAPAPLAVPAGMHGRRPLRPGLILRLGPRVNELGNCR